MAVLVATLKNVKNDLWLNAIGKNSPVRVLSRNGFDVTVEVDVDWVFSTDGDRRISGALNAIWKRLWYALSRVDEDAATLRTKSDLDPTYAREVVDFCVKSERVHG